MRGRLGIFSSFIKSAYDPDAAAYIAAVEEEDGEALETAIADAINDFVVGLKTDDIWDSVLASCIMMGARTLDGALVPLKGDAPTGVNLVGGDYTRTGGILGNGSTKYIDTNFLDSATYFTNVHAGIFQTVSGSGIPKIVARNGSTAVGSLQVVKISTAAASFNRSSFSNTLGTDTYPAFLCVSRTDTSNFEYVNNGSAASVSRASAGSASGVNFWVGRRVSDGSYFDQRFSFYTIGTTLSPSNSTTKLSAYETRINDLYDAIVAALP